LLTLVLLLQAAAGPACPNPDKLPTAIAARRCEGVGLAREQRWREAAGVFEAAAKSLNDATAAGLWAQAGNAWLAAGDPARAGAALDAALVWSAGKPAGERGELLLDRARAAVAAGDLEGARTVLDQAVKVAPAEPLAWLLSASLARRMGQPARAQSDIAEALKRGPDDAAVQLEAGNVAALTGNADLARERWENAARLDPDGADGARAKQALAQFGPGTP
jgi:tetratricopeptide (TPR) repeat protein